MSLRSLPAVKALQIEGAQWDAPADVVARWEPAVRAAADDAATITIYEQIGEDFWTGEGMTAKRVAGILRSIGARDVVVSINSPGGDFFEGIAIYNLLREHPHKVTVKVVGLAASAASVIAMAGDEIQVARSGFLMIHNAWSIVVGNRSDLQTAAETLATFDDAMADLYSVRAGVAKAKAAEMMDAETWMNGQEAVAQGFADALLSADEVTAEQDATNNARAAVRKMDVALAKQGMPRSERRALIQKIKGTHDAAPDATPRAGDLSAALADLRSTIRS